jgi:chloramphenicol 3-O-phosphotransferase
MVHAVVISGTLGAGKTRVAEELRDLVAERGSRCAVIDLDWLCQLDPSPENDPYNDRLGFANLAAIWPNYTAAGIDYLILARVVEDRGDRKRYLRAMPGASVAIVRVVASSPVRQQRLRQRMPEGQWLDGHLARTDQLAARLAELSLDDHVVDNDVRPPSEVATEILRLLGW